MEPQKRLILGMGGRRYFPYVFTEQWVVQRSGGIIPGSTAIDDSTLAMLRLTLAAKEVPELLGIYLQSFIVQLGIHILSIAIFVIINGCMIEIYLMTSLAPIPFATYGNL